MKLSILVFLLCGSTGLFAQPDSLAPGVYRWNAQPAKQAAGRESRPLLLGSTTDLASLKIHTSTLAPGIANHPLQAYNDREEIVVIKQGRLTVTINDSSKTLGPGSIVLICAGDKQRFQNASDSPATYCVLAFQSRLPIDGNRGKAGGGSLLKEWTELPVKKTEKGESRPVFDRPSSAFRRFEIHATALNAGMESHAPHTHRAEELMLLMKGSVTANIADKKQEASAGDVILLTPNVPHNVTNTGSEQCWYYAIKWFIGEYK